MVKDFFLSLLSQAAYALNLNETGLDVANGGLFGTKTIEEIVGLIIQSALALIGVIFLVLIVYAGILWMTAQGEDKKISTARGYIFHSILGLIIVMAAYALTSYVIQKLAAAALN